MLTVSIVAELRRIAHQNNGIDADHYASVHKVSVGTIEKAVRGTHFKDVNPISPPFMKTMAHRVTKEKARELYQNGKTYNQISDILGIAKSSVSVYCNDLAELKRLSIKEQDAPNEDIARLKARELYQEGLSVNGIIKEIEYNRSKVSEWCKDLIVQNEKNKRIARDIRNRSDEHNASLKINGKLNGHQVLTLDDVVEMRRQVRKEGVLNLRYYAEKYQVTIASISVAIRGKTFQHANHLEPPVTETLPKTPRPVKSKTAKKSSEKDALIAEMITMRRSDPSRWNYVTLASWMSDKTGGVVNSGNVARMLIYRDPSLKDIKEGIGAKTKTDKANLPKGKKILTPQEAAIKLWNRRQADARRREALRKAIAEEDAYESAMSAGLITR